MVLVFPADPDPGLGLVDPGLDLDLVPDPDLGLAGLQSGPFSHVGQDVLGSTGMGVAAIAMAGAATVSDDVNMSAAVIHRLQAEQIHQTDNMALRMVHAVRHKRR